MNIFQRFICKFCKSDCKNIQKEKEKLEKEITYIKSELESIVSKIDTKSKKIKCNNCGYESDKFSSTEWFMEGCPKCGKKDYKTI